MTQLEQICEFNFVVTRITSDSRVDMKHLALMTAIIAQWVISDFASSISVSRRTLMRRARIRSTATYHKALKELQKFGYIRYHPSYNPLMGSRIDVLDGRVVL